MLSERRQRVLTALIEEYIANALPVGSRTLVEHYKLGVSSATVRNELSVLEDVGYIEQPHKSAGRVPTDSGYRAFVDDLLETEFSSDEPVDDAAIRQLQKNANELDELLEKTSAALTQLTDCLSIVLPPSIVSFHVKQLNLVALSSHRVLMVIVTEDGQVLNRSVEFASAIKAEQIQSIEALFNSLFAGKSFAEIKDGIDPERLAALSDPYAQILLSEFFQCIREGNNGKAHSLGVTSLMKKPEFSHPSALIPVIQMLEDDSVLMKVLDDTAYKQGTMIKIGSENETEQLKDVSVVATKFGKDDATGVLAVVGPTRMNYSQVIKAVRAARSSLQDL